MIELESSAQCLWQWNTQQRIVTDYPPGTVFDFAQTDTDALERTAYAVGSRTVCDIPNALLQLAGTLYIYVHRAEAGQLTTVLEASYPVRAQPKPRNYINDEAEILIWHQLESRLDKLEEGGLADAVRYGAPQKLTEEQQELARTNIAALGTQQLPAAIEQALSKAHASGAFDGADGVNGLKIMAAQQGGPERQPEKMWDTLGRYGSRNQMTNIGNAAQYVVGDMVIISGLMTDRRNAPVLLIGKVAKIVNANTLQFHTIGLIKSDADQTEDQLVLIERIEPSGSRKLIEKTAEPDGTAYNFRAVSVSVTIPASEDPAKNLTVTLGWDNGDKDVFRFGPVAGQTCSVYLERRDGVKRGTFSVHKNGVKQSQPIEVASAAAAISSVRIETGGMGLESGTLVEIQAVREKILG